MGRKNERAGNEERRRKMNKMDEKKKEKGKEKLREDKRTPCEVLVLWRGERNIDYAKRLK